MFLLQEGPFAENLVLPKNYQLIIFFSNLKKVEWISYIELDEVREVQIQSCFKCNAEFHYPTSILEFKDVLENFKVQSRASSETAIDSSSLMTIMIKKM